MWASTVPACARGKARPARLAFHTVTPTAARNVPRPGSTVACMEEPGFGGLVIVAAVSFAAPFLLGLAPRVRLPSVVFEIVAGIVIGPSVLGWVEIDDTISVLALMGLAILLFLAGLEIDFGRLRGRLLGLALVGWALSFGIAIVVSLLLELAGLVETPLLVAIILCATSLGVIIPVLKDVGELTSKFGQLVLAAASIADFGAVILLSFFFSGEGGPGSTAILLAAFVALLAVAFFVVRGAERSRRIEQDPVSYTHLTLPTKRIV